MTTAGDRRHSREVRPLVLGVLFSHFAVWWAVLSIPIIYKHDFPWAAAGLPIAPLGLIFDSGVRADPVLLGTAVLVWLAPVIWFGVWRKPGSLARQALAHVAIIVWWTGAILAMGIAF